MKLNLYNLFDQSSVTGFLANFRFVCFVNEFFKGPAMRLCFFVSRTVFVVLNGRLNANRTKEEKAIGEWYLAILHDLCAGSNIHAEEVWDQ